MGDLYDIEFRRMDGSTTSLAEHRDDVVLVVNVASRCGLAPQYATLESLQRRYAGRGFTVIGFPAATPGACGGTSRSSWCSPAAAAAKMTSPRGAKMTRLTPKVFSSLNTTACGRRCDQ